MDSQKSLFSIPSHVHYLNCAYMAPLAREVEEAGIAGMRRKRIPSEILSADFFRDSDELRALFARLINGDAARIAILPSASYGLAIAARNLPRHAGQNIVIAHEQFPANVYAWRRLCREEGVELRVVRPPDEAAGRGAAWNELLLQAIDRDTAAVAIGHVHWADGTRFDLEAIGQRAHEQGAALIVDGTQTVGAMPFDVQRIRPDALICAGYKWLMGPYSIAVGWFGPMFDHGVPLEETWIARRGSEDFRGLVNYQDEYQPGAVRYDVGERSNFILVPMLGAALRMVLAWQPGNVQAYCRELTRDLIERARGAGFTVESEEWRGAHLFGLRAPAGIDIQELQRLLSERNIAVSLRGSAVRVSPHVYNDADDVTALADALEMAVRRRHGS